MYASPWAVRFPWSLVLAALGLIAMGWIAMLRCDDLTGIAGRGFHRQVVWTLVAVTAACLAALPHHREACRLAYPIFLLAIICLIAVYFFPARNGARRWIQLGAIGFQPSEFAKPAFVLGMARFLMHDALRRSRLWQAGALALTAVPVVLILREPDLGTSMLFLPVVYGMLFAAGARRRDLATLALLGLLAAPFLWMQMSPEQRSRITSLFVQAGPNDPASSETYQLRQGKQLAALGGWWGSLPAGGGILDDLGGYHLPEARNDFVLSVLAERTGLWGMFVILSLYAIVVGRGLAAASATQDPFARLAAVGLSLFVAVQTLVNAGMAVGLLPVTGVSLPLISAGGSGMTAYGLSLGLLVNIAMRPGYDLAAEPFQHTA